MIEIGEINTNLESFLKFDVGKDDTVSYYFIFKVKNIGMNNIQKIKIDICIDEYKENVLGDKTLEVMEKGEERHIGKFINLEINKTYNMKFVVKYVDVLSNSYEQIIDMEYTTTTYSINGEYEAIIKYVVHEAELI